MKQPRFAELAENLFREETQLRNIAGAPGLVISLMYPMAGNEKALGLDYRTDEKQREAALRARDSRQLVLAGPVDLRQGGQGFIGRFPVFVDRDRPSEKFWGIVAAVIDVQELYRDSGLLDDRLSIEIALTGKDALGGSGARFYGDARIIGDNPVTADVALPSGSWQIAAIPKGGWHVTPANAWLLRSIMLIAGALVVVPILVAGRLIKERQQHYRDLRRSEQRLRRLLRTVWNWHSMRRRSAFGSSISRRMMFCGTTASAKSTGNRRTNRGASTTGQQRSIRAIWIEQERNSKRGLARGDTLRNTACCFPTARSAMSARGRSASRMVRTRRK